MTRPEAERTPSTLSVTESSDGSTHYATSGTGAIAGVTSATLTFEGSYVT